MTAFRCRARPEPTLRAWIGTLYFFDGPLPGVVAVGDLVVLERSFCLLLEPPLGEFPGLERS